MLSRAAVKAPRFARHFRAAAPAKDKIVCVLYPDPLGGYPPKYARDDVPKITGYADGTTVPSPSAIDYTPGELLGCVSGELGLRKFLEAPRAPLRIRSPTPPEASRPPLVLSPRSRPCAGPRPHAGRHS